MESVGDDANSVFHEDQKFFKSDTFESDTIFVTFKSVTFEIFGKCSESVNFDANNNLQEDSKIFKSDTFENYKSFVHAEVQSHKASKKLDPEYKIASSTALNIVMDTMKKNMALFFQYFYYQTNYS